ncbi:Pyridoxine/pyridoxamine 5'-phosphate oxidase [Cyclobacterium lianum]|uniref:Pyridoxine/pyridoxamine 5'-phosphate oxidase n=2 Tax=Cyclobacterium lianum TaxID=388280 RepID=A0A1M7PQR4_9BACT|nr:Pyridoxine/pyridoxamine 5'-phosphate oxidase [Cyclobacterium lianum]
MLFSEADALEEIQSTLMRELRRATLDQKHPFRFVSMATLSGSHPGLRYLVLRDLDEQERFYCYTDSRSHKVHQLRKNPALSLLFYHPNKRCQVKVQGRAVIHHQDEVSQIHWAKVQGEAEKSYQATIAPGTAIDDPKEAHSWDTGKADSQFVVLEIRPEIFECLQLDGIRHLRAIFKKSGDKWTHNWLAP